MADDAATEATWRSHIGYGPLTCGSGQKVVLPGLNSSLTLSDLSAMPAATSLPKAASASAGRSRRVLVR